MTSRWPVRMTRAAPQLASASCGYSCWICSAHLTLSGSRWATVMKGRSRRRSTDTAIKHHSARSGTTDSVTRRTISVVSVERANTSFTLARNSARSRWRRSSFEQAHALLDLAMPLVDVDRQSEGADDLVTVLGDDDVSDSLDPMDGSVGPPAPMVEAERLSLRDAGGHGASHHLAITFVDDCEPGVERAGELAAVRGRRASRRCCPMSPCRSCGPTTIHPSVPWRAPP